MSDFKENVNLIRANRPQFHDAKIKETGFKNTDDTISNDPTANAQPGYLWVHGYPRGANVQVIAGTSINPRIPNVLVWVGENHARQAVAFDVVTDDNAVNQWGAALPAIATNPTPVDVATQETPFYLLGGARALPVGTPSPGQFVFIEAFPEVGWPGGIVPISGADFPTNPNEYRWAVWRFPQAGRFTVGYVPTYALTTARVRPTLQAFVDSYLQDAAQLALDAGDIRAGAVTLGYNQTDLTSDQSNFANDLRRNFVPEDIVIVDRSGGVDGDVPTYVAATDSFVLAPTGGGGVGTDIAIIQDRKTQNTAGGTFTSGADQTRDLNTMVTNQGSHASVASNQITLAAGTYRILARAPAFYVQNHQAWLYNVTDSAIQQSDLGVDLLGTSEYTLAAGSGSSDGIVTHSIIEGRFTIAGSKVFEIRHRCATTKATNGFGVPANLHAEVFTTVRLEKES